LGPWIELGCQKLEDVQLGLDATRVVVQVGDRVLVFDAMSGEPVGEPITFGRGRFWISGDTHTVVKGVDDSHGGTSFRAYDLATGEPAGPLVQIGERYPEICVGPMRPRVFVNGGDARIYDLLTGKAATRRLPPSVNWSGVHVWFDPGERYLVILDVTGLSVLDARRGEPVLHLESPIRLRSMALSQHGTYVAAADDSGIVCVIPLDLEIGDPERLSDYAEIVSGQEVDDTGSLRWLLANEREVRRRAYVEAGGHFEAP